MLQSYNHPWEDIFPSQNLRQILQELPRPCSDYIVKRHPGNEKTKKTKTKQEVFVNTKAALCSDSVLRQYDPAAELI